MTTRRSFFTRLAQFAAVIAIAPQIAFGKEPEVWDGYFSQVHTAPILAALNKTIDLLERVLISENKPQ